MKRKYDYHIVTKKLNPPVGSSEYVARLDYLVKVNENKPRERLAIPSGLAEFWGKTESEVYQKMQKAVQDWIEQQKDLTP